MSPTDRAPMLIAFSVGAVATGVAVVTGIFAFNEYQSARSNCSPRCSESDLATGRALSLTSTAFAGLAALGVGAGITLLVLRGPGDSAQPSLALSVLPARDGARAGAEWRF